MTLLRFTNCLAFFAAIIYPLQIIGASTTSAYHVRRVVVEESTSTTADNDDSNSNNDNDTDETMIIENIYDRVSQIWELEGIDALTKAVAIDSLSPNFNSEWSTTGVYDTILDYYVDYATEKLGDVTTITSKKYGKETSPPLIDGMDDSPPMLLLTIEGTDTNANTENVIVYMHADTQPFNAEDWESNPLIAERKTIDGKDQLFGRGTTDDKYAFFSVIIGIQTLIEQGLSFPTIHILAETEEESSSQHIGPYIDQVLKEIGTPPTAVFILDSGGVDNTRMWNSRTLRGVVAIILTVQIAETTSHSGCFGGIIPPPLLLMTTLLSDRIENSQTGEIFAPPSLLYEPSEADIMSAQQRVDLYGADVLNANWIDGASPLQDATATPTYDEIVEILMRNNYGSSLAVVGIDEDVMPDLYGGGNVIYPYIKGRLQFRTSPYTNVTEAYEEIKQTLEAGPQNYGATVTVELDSIVQGFEAEPLPAWFRIIVDTAATQIYNQGDNKSFVDSGVGGTIGFLAVIQESLKDTDAIIFNTGLFDGDCNCHGPDESLDIAAVKKFTSVFAYTVHSMLTAADKNDDIVRNMMDEEKSPEEDDTEEGEATTVASIVFSSNTVVETPPMIVGLSKFTTSNDESSSSSSSSKSNKSNMLTGTTNSWFSFVVSITTSCFFFFTGLIDYSFLFVPIPFWFTKNMIDQSEKQMNGYSLKNIR